MLDWLKGFFQKSPARDGRFSRRLPDKINLAGGFYDLERTDASVEEHLKFATNGSADFHANHTVRQIIRRKVRYEYANNSILKGLVQSRSESVVGRGVRIKLVPQVDRMPGASSGLRVDSTANRRLKRAASVAKNISKKLNSWLEKVDFKTKLRQMVKAKLVDGESFMVFLPSDTVDHPIKLFPRVMDSDRVTDGYGKTGTSTDDGWVDGIKYQSETGVPYKYRFLKDHPHGEYVDKGLLGLTPSDDLFREYSSEFVFHYFRRDFGEHHRGISELMPSLEILAVLRRVRKATALSVENAANISAVLTSEIDTDASDVEMPNLWDEVRMAPNSILTLPNGTKIDQMEAKHPNAQYESFRDACLSDAGRALNMPFNRASGSSAGYNFSSAKLDGLSDLLTCEIERDDIREGCLEKAIRLAIAFSAGTGYWTEEEEAYLLAERDLPDHKFHFELDEKDIDPHKETLARDVAIKGGFASRASIVADKGWDLEEFDTALAESYGVTVEEYREALFKRDLEIQPDPSPIQQGAND